MMTRNNLAKRIFCMALLALGTTDAVSAAPSYSISGDFGSAVFKYGDGDGGSSFTQTSTQTACEPQLACYLGAQAGIYKNVSATDTANGTVQIPAGTVDFHPGAGVGGTDAIIRFVAPVSAVWQVSGTFWRNDVTEFGNGTQLSLFKNIGGVSSLVSSNFVAPNSFGQVSNFMPFSVNLGAGDFIEFGLNNIDGQHFFDSTGVDATFTAAVPEPASWAMLIAGFGVVGAAARRRRVARMIAA